MKKVRSVFYDIGFSETEALYLTLKSKIYIKLLDTIKRRKWKSRDLEKILDIPQPRVSELLNEKITSVSIEKLLVYLERLGIQATLTFKAKRAS